MAIYLKLAGITGNVTAKGYEKQIAVDSLHFAVTRNISMESGNTSNRESSKPQLSEITISKKADSSVALVFKESCSGAAGKEAVISFVSTNKDGVKEFMTYTLSDCMISGYSVSAQGDDQPMENISLSYSKIIVSYTDKDKSMANGNPTRATYDVATARSL